MNERYTFKESLLLVAGALIVGIVIAGLIIERS